MLEINVPSVNNNRVRLEMDRETAQALLVVVGALHRGQNDRLEVTRTVSHDTIRPHTDAIYLSLVDKVR